MWTRALAANSTSASTAAETFACSEKMSTITRLALMARVICPL